MSDDFERRIMILEDKYVTLENIIFKDNGIVPQLREIKASIVDVNFSIDKMTKILDKIDEHDKLFEGFRQSLADMMVIRKECSERIALGMENIHLSSEVNYDSTRVKRIKSRGYYLCKNGISRQDIFRGIWGLPVCHR